MKTIACYVAILLFQTVATGQKKAERIPFCGVVYKNQSSIKKLQNDQFQFLNVTEYDTIVDIGAGSGWYEGAFSAVMPFNDLHFILVDIDSTCLNQQKVRNMTAHYSGVKGTPITNTFTLVRNTPDSLHLPVERFRKAWLLNVLHEIEAKPKMIRDIHAILQKGGELILLEYIPLQPDALHGGCRKPLLSLDEWTKLFEEGGFHMKEYIQVRKVKGVPRINLIRFIKD